MTAERPEPRTEAGRRLLDAAQTVDNPYLGIQLPDTFLRDAILDIEAEAALPVPAPQAVPVITEDPEANGDLDDLFVNGGIDSFHVERMDSGHWWFAVYLNDGTRLNFNLHSSRKITARVEREETGPIQAALPVPALDALTYERAWMDLMDEARAFEEAVIADLIGIARDYRARRDAEHAALGEDVK